MLNVGQKAPLFTLNDTDGNPVSLAGFAGKKAVIYFYPKDDTPGCTIEACSFRDSYDDILAAGAVVLGISPDGKASHERFRNKFGLPFHLLSDPDHTVATAFGAWGEKVIFGIKTQGLIRSTFIIDGEGVVTHVFPKVTPTKHAQEVLEALK